METETTAFSTTTPLKSYESSGSYQFPDQSWTAIPDIYFHTLQVIAGNQTRQAGKIDRTLKFAELQGKRLSITFSGTAQARLWLDDENPNTETGGTGDLYVTLTASYPRGTWNYSAVPQTLILSTAVNNQTETKKYLRTASAYTIIYGFETTGGLLAKRQQQLDVYRRQGLGNSTREVISESLNVLGQRWLFQVALADQLIAAQSGISSCWNHRVGRVAQEAGYYIDVGLIYGTPLPTTDSTDQQKRWNAFDVSNYFGSAMEHSVLEQLQPVTGSSTMKVLHQVNAASPSQKIFRAHSGNWSTVSSQLIGYDITALTTKINNGSVLLIPTNGNVFVGSWHGRGYVERKQTATRLTIGMIINGSYGGYASILALIDSVPIQNTHWNSPHFFNIVPPATPTTPGADPVNMADGSFTLNSTDLSVGLAEPRGFSFSRHYSSNRRNQNPANMAHGWTHNYKMYASEETSIEAGLGLRTPAEMASCLVATKAALDVYSGTEENWLDDAFPAGATPTANGESWTWVGSNPTPFSGTLAHRSPTTAAQHEHGFEGATTPVTVDPGDRLFTYVYLEAGTGIVPTEIMLEWHVAGGNWEHRAYWGANTINRGVTGTVSRYYMGALPGTGKWVRLEVRALSLGLEGTSIDGMKFTLYGGKATWDFAGINHQSAKEWVTTALIAKWGM